MGKIKALRDEINRLTLRNSEIYINLTGKMKDIICLEAVNKNLKKEINYYKKVLNLINKDSKILVVNELTKDNIKEYLKDDRENESI